MFINTQEAGRAQCLRLRAMRQASALPNNPASSSVILSGTRRPVCGGRQVLQAEACSAHNLQHEVSGKKEK